MRPTRIRDYLMHLNIKYLITLLCLIYSSFLLYGQELIPVKDIISNKYGYKEKGGVEWSLPPIYNSALYFHGNIAIVSEDYCEYAINLHGERVSPKFKEIQNWNNHDFSSFVCEDIYGKRNFYDYLFKPLFENAFDFLIKEGNLLWFANLHRQGYMDLEGKIMIPPIYDRLKLVNLYDIYAYKRGKKDGLDKKMFDETFVLAQNKESLWGIITLSNDTIVPFKYKNEYDVKYKGAKAYYKKTIKPFLFSERKKEIDDRILCAKKRIQKKNEELSQKYPTDLPKVEKTLVKRTKKGYSFFKAGKQVGKTYQRINSLSKCCIVSNNGRYGVTNPLGGEIVKCEYNNICIWNTGNGDDILMTEKNGKYELINTDGDKLATNCDMIFLPLNKVGVALKDKLYWLIGSDGKIVSKHGYENIDNYSTDGKIYAELIGYRTELSIFGNEETPILKQIFDEAYNLSLSNNAQKKYDKYMLCISLDKDNNEGYRAMSLNNIGSMFEDLGDVDKAMEYYEESRALGNETARKNIKRIKLNRTLDAIQQVGNTLSQIGQSIDTSGSYNVMQDNGTYSGSASSSKSQNSNKYNIGEQNSYNTDKRTWGNYDSMLAAHFAGNKPATKNDVRQWQQKMSSLRSKWTSKGKSFPSSSNENRSLSGCANGSHSH